MVLTLTHISIADLNRLEPREFWMKYALDDHVHAICIQTDPGNVITILLLSPRHKLTKITAAKICYPLASLIEDWICDFDGLDEWVRQANLKRPKFLEFSRAVRKSKFVDEKWDLPSVCKSVDMPVEHVDLYVSYLDRALTELNPYIRLPFESVRVFDPTFAPLEGYRFDNHSRLCAS